MIKNTENSTNKQQTSLMIPIQYWNVTITLIRLPLFPATYMHKDNNTICITKKIVNNGKWIKIFTFFVHLLKTTVSMLTKLLFIESWYVSHKDSRCQQFQNNTADETEDESICVVLSNTIAFRKNHKRKRQTVYRWESQSLIKIRCKHFRNTMDGKTEIGILFVEFRSLAYEHPHHHLILIGKKW